MKLLWMIVAGLCIVAAAVFLLRGDLNVAFVVAVVGLGAWFLNYRSQVQQSLEAEDLQQDSDHEGGENLDEEENGSKN